MTQTLLESGIIKTVAIIICFWASTTVFAQDNGEPSRIDEVEQQLQSIGEVLEQQKKLKVSGYIQTQMQYGESGASLKVGAANENADKEFWRLGVRRGRIKFTYTEGFASGVFQLDITEKGVGFKDAYLNFKDIWVGTNAFRAGIFDRPFGYEIGYSSSQRESPERSTVFQTLFPDERDLGAMFVLQPGKTSPWNFIKFEGGLFAGNGIKSDTDSKKDFIAHLSAVKDIGNSMKLGLGLSGYWGNVYQGTENVYTMVGNAFVLNNNAENKGQFAKRRYFGIDAQANIISVLGMTKLHAEYLTGNQPGGKTGSKSPNTSALPTSDTYIRNFNGGYLMLVQDLGSLPLAAIVKYDWYDPNTKVSGNEVGNNGTDKGDIAYNTVGLGLLWRINTAIRIQAYFDMITNETSEYLAGYGENIKDNTFTLRVQYKF